MDILDNYYWEWKSIREKITELEEENRKLKEELGVWLNANKILRMHDAKMEYENKKLKEERDNFMLKYAKALEEKIVQTNELCTERNKLGEENKRLRSERDKWRGKYNRLKSEFNLLKNKIWTTQK